MAVMTNKPMNSQVVCFWSFVQTESICGLINHTRVYDHNYLLDNT